VTKGSHSLAQLREIAEQMEHGAVLILFAKVRIRCFYKYLTYVAISSSYASCMHVVLIWLFRFCFSANDCGKLLIPQNGSLLGNKTTFPNFVTFSCDEGFILKGSEVRHCQANKTWTGEITYCNGK